MNKNSVSKKLRFGFITIGNVLEREKAPILCTFMTNKAVKCLIFQVATHKIHAEGDRSID